MVMNCDYIMVIHEITLAATTCYGAVATTHIIYMKLHLPAQAASCQACCLHMEPLVLEKLVFVR